MKEFPPSISFRTGAVRSREVAYILAEDDDLSEQDLSHTIVLTWHKGKWFYHTLSWVAISACVLRKPTDRLLAISGEGDFLIFGQGETTEGVIQSLPTPQGKPGPYRCVREFCGQSYVVGSGGLAMVRNVNGQWLSIDKELPVNADLESISGFSDTEVYAVGWKGQIWTYNSESWRMIESPTDVILTDVICAPDGFVYAVGQRGTILKGRHDNWEVLQQTRSEGDFWSVTWFNKSVLLSTMTSVYVLVNGQLEPTKFGDDYPDTMYNLSAADGQLWSIGSHDIMANDGKLWRRIE